MNFVERVLILHDFSNIQNFSLSCDVLCDASRINAWISAAVRHKVHKFDLCLYNVREPFVLPHCLFTCESLTVLELWMCYLLKSPSSICFSRLKTLTLTQVIFLNDYSTEQLFSGCPLLEELSINECDWVNLKAVSISSPRLESLVINDDLDSQNGSNGCQVMIYGMSIKSFTYTGELINDYCFFDSFSLVDAYIHLFGWGARHREVAYRANKLLRALSNAKHLILSLDTIEVLSHAEELFAHLPTFSNLTHLELNILPMDFASGALLNMLQHSPCLSFLEFDGGIYLSTYCEEDDWILDPVPPCFLSHLTAIKIWNFYGNEEELYVVKILLKNATVLERMVIYCIKEFEGGLQRQKEVQERLLMLARGSKSCATATDRVALLLVLTAPTFAFVPLRHLILLVFLDAFTREMPLRKDSSDRWLWRVREWWVRIPAAPVQLIKPDDKKKRK